MTQTSEPLEFDDEFEQVERESQPEEPKSSRGTGGSSGTRRRGRPPGTGRVPKRVQQIGDTLAQQMFTAGTMIGLGLPVTGFYIAQESQLFCDAIMRLAAKNPQYLDALENLAAIGPGVTIGRTVLGMGCAIGVDRWHKTDGERGISPDKKAAMFLGVAQAYYEVYGDDGNSAGPGFAPPPHATFTPVS